MRGTSASVVPDLNMREVSVCARYDFLTSGEQPTKRRKLPRTWIRLFEPLAKPLSFVIGQRLC